MANLSVYGILSHYRFFPKDAIQVLDAKLDTNHPPTRSLVLDFMEQKSMSNPQLKVLAPKVLERFRANPEDPNFPLVADAELGHAAGSPMTERFRLARILVLMDAETDDVTQFLMNQVTVEELHGRLFELARVKGKEGRPMLLALLNETGFERWQRGTTTFMRVGLPKEHVPSLLTILEARVKEVEAAPDDFDTVFGTVSLLDILVKAELAQPERIQALLKELFESKSENVKVTAICIATVQFPESEIAAEASVALAKHDWSDLVNDTEKLLLATYNLQQQSLLKPFTVSLRDTNDGPLLQWVLAPKAKPAKNPRFVEQFAEGEVYFDKLSGLGLELMEIQLRWLIANPRAEARPGLEKLTKAKNPELAKLAETALSNL